MFARIIRFLEERQEIDRKYYEGKRDQAFRAISAAKERIEGSPNLEVRRYEMEMHAQAISLHEYWEMKLARLDLFTASFFRIPWH